MSNEILEMIEEKKYTRLRKQLTEMNPADIAGIFEELSPKDLPIIFRILPKELAAETFVEMDSDMQQQLLEGFSDKEIRDVMDELFMDDTVDIIDEMPATVAKRILKQTDATTRKLINKLLAYPDDSAGSIMTTEYIDLKKDMTVDEAFDRIRFLGVDTESIYTCYVTDKSRRLLGVVTVKELLLNPKDMVIGEIMRENIIFANTFDDKEEVAGQFRKYDLVMLPVVDKEERLVGIVTVDDAIDVIEEEATEDIEKMAAIVPTEKSYFKAGVFDTFKSRIPWLMLLMISATFTGAIISSFESKLTVFPALIAFIPMLMDTAGNCGSQSSVTVIRGISLGDIKFKDIFRVLWKEIRVAVCCSVALAAVNFLKLWIIDYMIFGNFDSGKQFAEIAVVCLTMMLTVIAAKIVGCVLPVLAKKIGFDPAVMASPFITTIVDAIALVIYFNFAVLMLGI
ncbi:MAG: magnesium transporter [Acutalibacteraceae bacterium]|nr:magnesium transporter [Acutalibacteraceae bacterium]